MNYFPSYSTQELLVFKEEFDRFIEALSDTYDGGRELLHFVLNENIDLAVFNKIDSEAVDILLDDFFTLQSDEDGSEKYDEAYCSDWNLWCDSLMHLIDEGHSLDNMDACKITNWSRSGDPFELFREPHRLVERIQNVLCEMIANQKTDVNEMLEELSCIENIDAPLQIAIFRRLAKRVEYLEGRVEQLEKACKK